MGLPSLLDRPSRRGRGVNLNGRTVAPRGASLHPTGAQTPHRQALAIVSLLSLFALAVQGFHPFAEDGGLYVAGIKKMLDPALYTVRPEFVVAHLRFSPFASTVAGITRITHIPLPWMLLALYCASVWATLYAGWMVAARCVETRTAQFGAVALLACWLTIPIAGTSLMLMDPYVTARSVSTPLTLLAIAWALDATAGSWRGGILCALALTLSAVHPLMAGYALATVVTLAVVGADRPQMRRWGPLLLWALGMVLAAVVQASAPVESAQYVAAAMTRSYWFPLKWHGYELFGLAAPMAVLIALSRASGSPRWRALARMAITLGAISTVLALAFSRVGLATHLVARLQPLRCFQVVYEVMILLLGAWLGERWLRREPWRWALLLAGLGGAMFFAQRSTYPASAHFEFPGATPANPWSQAFIWIRDNTPKDAVFALDPHYITRDGEDAQGFRGIAERNVLPDYSKDGGETSITPDLANAWTQGQEAQDGLDAEGDAIRAAKLKPLGVGWVVLTQTSATAWPCPYRNQAVKVCKLP